MSDVADAAGVTKPVLYQHFPSKRALYLEVLHDAGHRLADSLEKATSIASGPRDQVERGLLAFFQFVQDERSAFTVLFGGGTRRDQEFAQAAAEVEHAIAASIASRIDVVGLGHIERAILGSAIVGLAAGASRQWVQLGLPEPPEQLAQLVGTFAWTGLRGLSVAATPT